MSTTTASTVVQRKRAREILAAVPWFLRAKPATRDRFVAQGTVRRGMVPKTPKQKAGSTGSVSRRRIQSVGKRISLSLEDEFWEAFNEIARSRRICAGRPARACDRGDCLRQSLVCRRRR